MEGLYIAIAIIASGIGLFVYIRYFKENRDPELEDPSPVPPIPAPPVSAPPVPVPDVSASPIPEYASLDQKYADEHGMWICTYCETMNNYPAGITPKRKKAEPAKVIDPDRSSGLRGDLMRKANANRDSIAGEVCVLTCIACGKRQ